MNITAFIGSSRIASNSEQLADYVLADIPHQKIDLKNITIKPIHDLRHDDNGFQFVDDDYDQIIQAFLTSDIVIFATPIYWYSMSGTMKLFIDRWSQTLRDPEYPDFKDTMSSKEAYVIAVGGDNPYIKGLPLIQQFQYIFDFMGISFAGYVIGEGNKPGDIMEDSEALFAAEQIQQALNSSK